MEEMQTWAGIRAVLRRRRRAFLSAFTCLFLASVLVALLLPSVYRSTAQILIEEQQIPQEYVKTTVTSFVEERLQQIYQQVLSRATLIDIIKRFELYRDRWERDPMDEIVEKMRRSIEMRTVSAEIADRKTGRTTSATVAFTLSYSGENPAVVQKVTDTLASLYLNENLKTRGQQASNTTAFLEQELENVRGQAQRLSDQLSAFKRTHIGELPEFNPGNLQALGHATRDVDQIEAQIRSLQERRVYLEGQLAMIDPVATGGNDPGSPRQRLRELKVRLALLRGVTSETHPDVKALRAEIRELEAQVGVSDSGPRRAELAALREELSKKQAQLGPRHPDVVAASKQLELLAREEQAADRSRAAERPDNPAYVTLKAQMVAADLDLKSLVQARQKAEEKIRRYEGAIARAPLAEQEYSRLTRDYQTAQKKYEDLMNKLMEARVAQGMEESQKGERFTILDPAEFPETPYKPNRYAIALIGFVLALGGGTGLAAARETLDQALKTVGEVEEAAELPVLCALPLIGDAKAASSRRRKTLLWLLLAVLVVLALVLVFHYAVMPLDVFWFKLQRRIAL